MVICRCGSPARSRFERRRISPHGDKDGEEEFFPGGFRGRLYHTFIMFSFSTNIFLWHFHMNGQAKCTSIVHPKGLWNPMLDARETLKIDFPNEKSLRKFEDHCSVFPISCQYVNTKVSTQKNVNNKVLTIYEIKFIKLYTRRNSPKHDSIEWCTQGVQQPKEDNKLNFSLSICFSHHNAFNS